MAQHEAVVQRAEEEGERIVSEAEESARKMRLESEDYIDAKLAQFEITLQKITEDLMTTNDAMTRTIDQVQGGREKLRGVAPATNPELGPDVSFPEDEEA